MSPTWFTQWADFNDADLTNMKLQKLLYYAQGHYLAFFGEPLFEEELEAWSHETTGSFRVSRFQKQWFRGDIPPTPDFDLSSIDPDTTKFLQKIWNTYGGIAAWKLRDMTHSEDPWSKHFEDNERNVVIPKDSLKRWFKSTAKK